MDVLISLQLSESAEIYVTGHSLGGAIATICAFDLATRGLNLRGVVTFGSPRLGNSEFETLYHNLISKKGIPSSRFVAIDKGQTHQDAVSIYSYFRLPWCHP